jgi:hypothetical protein
MAVNQSGKDPAYLYEAHILEGKMAKQVKKIDTHVFSGNGMWYEQQSTSCWFMGIL